VWTDGQAPVRFDHSSHEMSLSFNPAIIDGCIHLFAERCHGFGLHKDDAHCAVYWKGETVSSLTLLVLVKVEVDFFCFHLCVQQLFLEH
jgi:hypothetical protein